MNNKSGSEQEPSWHKYCRQVMAFLNMSETTDTEYPYRCLAQIDETVKNMKAERIGKQIDRLIKEETYHLQKLCEERRVKLDKYKAALDRIVKYFNEDGLDIHNYADMCHKIAKDALEKK